MIRSPEELTEPIKAAVNRRAVVFSHTLLAVTIATHSILDPTANTFERVIPTILAAGLIVLIFLRMFDLIRVNSRPLVYIVTYQVFAFLGLGFTTDPATPYALTMFIIVYLSNLYYGSKGVWITVATFAATTIAKYIYMDLTLPLTVSDKLNIVATFLVFLAVCSFFINIQKVFDWDRARLHDTIKEALVEQKRLRALINNMTESVLVLDKEGIIRLYNAAALALFNTNNSLSDKPLDGFVKFEDEKGKIITSFDLMPKDTKPIIRKDVMLRYGVDDTAALSLVVTPIRSTYGQEKDEAGFVMTLRDITREKSLEEERDEFISVISHELRTPVTVAEAGVSNALMLANKLEGGEKIRDSLKTAHDQAVYLANMLNDLTTFARAEKGTLELELEEFDPRELLTRLKGDYQGAVEAKKMSIITLEDPSTPLRIASNRLYIREILQNFITNSIKYSDKGTITLAVRAKDRGVLFSVSDEGIGISVSDQKKIFEKFFRSEDYRTRSTNGTGLGLYITKKLAKILNATFEIQSEVGKGSIFSVYIPDMSDVLKAKKEAASQPIQSHRQTNMHPPLAPAVPPTAALPAASPAVPPAAPAQLVTPPVTPTAVPVSGSTLSPISPSITGLAPSAPPSAQPLPQPVAEPPQPPPSSPAA